MGPIWQELIECFGIQLEVQDMVAEVDRVGVRSVERGRSLGAVGGIAATGRVYEIAAMEWFVLKDGLVQVRWGGCDSASQRRQKVPLE